MRKFLPLIALLSLTLIVGACKGSTPTETTNEPPAQGQDQPAPSVEQMPAQQPTQELGDPTVVAEGQTPEDHIKAYFDAYKEGRYEDAFELQPAENKAKQPKDQFVPLRQSMPISAYTVKPTETNGNQTTISVQYDLGQNGSWVSTWNFEKDGDKWIAVRYLASMGQ